MGSREHQPRPENTTVMHLLLTLVCKYHLGSHSISLGLSFIICKVGVIVLALYSSLSYLENQMQSTEKVLSLSWVSHSSPLGQSPSKVTRALWPNLNPTGEEKWWYFKIKMLRGGPCSSQIEGPRTQIAIFLILSTQEGAQLSYGNDYMGSSQDALFQFDKGVD